MQFHRAYQVVTPTNIAVLKYWGKQDAYLNLPVNSSISVTLHTDDLRTETTVVLDSSFTEDRITLNGEETPLNERVKKVLHFAREMSIYEGKDCFIHINSRNTFPTAAGLASSASGYCALALAVIHVLKIEASPYNKSFLARIGSGSACRSLYGGVVAWELTEKNDSISYQIDNWELSVFICIVSADKKKVSSTDGMNRTLATSDLFKERKAIANERFEQFKDIVSNRDFEAFAELTMRDSNTFHALCLDSYPPIRFMNDTSHAIIDCVHHMNQACGRNVACYTFDAGPNAVIFCLPSDAELVENHLSVVLEFNNIQLLKTKTGTDPSDNELL
ncbi:hypothetical protein PCE1_004349 [Barthelona sp. PCE]